MANQEFGKKLETFSACEIFDYIGESEITVTITLAEYRTLVTTSAITKEKIDAANKDKYSRESENADLKANIAELKQELYELKKKLEEAQEVAGEEVAGDEADA